MAMFFDDKKKISLSGNKAKGKKEGKDQFLQRTRQDREERKQDKERQSAAKQVTRFLHYAHQLRVAQRRERTFFDEEVVFSGSSPIQKNGLIALLRQFLFFYQAPVDNDRFITLSQRLVDNVSKEQDIKMNYCGTAVAERASFLHQMKRFLRVCLRILSNDHPNFNCKIQAAKVLVVFTYFTHWKFTKETPELVGQLTTTCDVLLRHMVDHEQLYVHLQKHFKSFIDSVIKNKPVIPREQWNTHFVSAVTLSIRPILVTSEKEKYVEKFLGYILTIPSFISKMPPITTQILLSTNTIPNLVNMLCNKMRQDQTQQLQFLTVYGDPSYNALALLGNVLDLQRASKVEYNADLILSLLQLCNTENKRYDPLISSQLSPLYSSETVFSFFGKLGNSTPHQTEPELQIETSSGPKHYRITSSIFSFFGLSSYSSSTTREGSKYSMVPMEELNIKDVLASEVIDIDRLATIAEIYLELVSRFPFSRLSVLNTLTFSTPLTRSLWMWMCAYGIQKQLLTHKLTRILTLFCECYSHLLLVLDDSEFYGENQIISSNRSNYNSNNNFSLREVVGMLVFLKKLVLSLFQSENANTALKDAATRLVNQLYERESRRSFCPPKFWIFKEIKYEAFFNPDLEEEQASALRQMIHTVPWSCSFDIRVKIFSAWIAADRHPTPLHRPTAQIRRGHELEDGLAQLKRVNGNVIKSQCVRIVFRNSSGVLEDGIDHGGLFKEFVSNILTQGFNPNRSGLFITTPSHTLYPNPKSYLVDSNHLVIFELLGKMLAKAIYDGVVVDLPLAGFFMSKILGKYNFFHELSTMDPELYKNLLFIKHYDEQVEDLSLTFSVNEDDGKRSDPQRKRSTGNKHQQSAVYPNYIFIYYLSVTLFK